MKTITKAMNALCALGLVILLTAPPAQAASIVYDYTGTLTFSPDPSQPVDLLGLNGAAFHWVGTFTAGDTPAFTNNINLDRFAGTITLTLSGTVGGLRDGTYTPTANTISEVYGSGGNDQFQFSNAADFQIGAIRLSLGTILVPPGFTGAVSPTNTLTPFTSSDVLVYDSWSAADAQDARANYGVAAGSASGVVTQVVTPIPTPVPTLSSWALALLATLLAATTRLYMRRHRG